ncbi:MAG: pyridoxamine 5'-phosphate oxidase family protein [Clostridia bacterium]|nr:pyridoxamine 5'-phosphate oxidase family protein [Clostridia bacterium]
MFREMRRKNQVLPENITNEVLERGSNGILSVIGDDGYPYSVPVSYAMLDGKIYFHCAKMGHKIDAITNCDKACFTVVDKDEIVQDEFTTYFRSAVVFGRAKIVTDKELMLRAIYAISRKYCPDMSIESHNAEVNKEMPALCIVEITPEHISGKEARELAKMRKM